MRGTFRSIQYLRAVAALIVVFHHARNPLAWLYDPIGHFVAGQAGVDIFFVISGFIMYTAARAEAPIDFLRRRVLRIAPLYWVATAGAFLVAERARLHDVNAGDALDLVRSVLFIPYYNRDYPGMIWPVLLPGWTLNFEMFFYVLFAIGLVSRHVTTVVGVAVTALVLLGLIVTSHNPLWRTYSDPLMLEFLAGLGIARCRGSLGRAWLIWLVPLGAVAIGLSGLVDAPRVLLWGVPAVAIVAGAVACEDVGRLPVLPWLGRLGDASYSIYLFQFLAIAVLARVVHDSGLRGPLQLLAIIGGTLAAAIVLGLAGHYLLERPINRWAARRRPGGRTEAHPAV